MFYTADLATPEQRGEDVSGRLIFAPEDAVSLSLEYLPPGADPLTILLSTNDDTNNSNASNNQSNSSNNGNNNSNGIGNHSTNTTSNRRYLQCPALVTIAHLKKFLALKYSVDMTRYNIEICHRRAPLPEHWTLMDVAYIYAWKRVNYSQFQLPNILTRWSAHCKIHFSQDVKMCSRYKTMVHEIRFSRFDQIKALKHRSISMKHLWEANVSRGNVLNVSKDPLDSSITNISTTLS